MEESMRRATAKHVSPPRKWRCATTTTSGAESMKTRPRTSILEILRDLTAYTSSKDVLGLPGDGGVDATRDREKFFTTTKWPCATTTTSGAESTKIRPRTSGLESL